VEVAHSLLVERDAAAPVAEDTGCLARRRRPPATSRHDTDHRGSASWPARRAVALAHDQGAKSNRPQPNFPDTADQGLRAHREDDSDERRSARDAGS
jgi:hypothetical protein